jgi:hypothetical protein
MNVAPAAGILLAGTISLRLAKHDSSDELLPSGEPVGVRGFPNRSHMVTAAGPRNRQRGLSA